MHTALATAALRSRNITQWYEHVVALSLLRVVSSGTHGGRWQVRRSEVQLKRLPSGPWSASSAAAGLLQPTRATQRDDLYIVKDIVGACVLAIDPRHFRHRQPSSCIDTRLYL